VKLSEPGEGTVAFVDQDITAPGDWFCTKNDLVVDTVHALTTIEEELFSLKSSILSRLLP